MAIILVTQSAREVTASAAEVLNGAQLSDASVLEHVAPANYSM